MKRFGMTVLVALALATNLLAVGKQPTTERENWNVNINVNQLSKYLQKTKNQPKTKPQNLSYF